MLVILVTLLVIVAIAGWILFHAQDEVHNIAATIAGLIAIFWLFSLVSLPIKLLLLCLILLTYQRIHIAQK